MSSTTGKQALVFGASGISGWGICKELLRYPESQTFSRIVGLTNRPLTIEASGLPTDDARLSLVSGVNLLGDLDNIKKALRDKVEHIGQITHVYFTAYVDAASFNELRETNVAMLSRAAQAVSDECVSLQMFMLQTGGKSYGVQFNDTIPPPPTPVKESTPRITGPHADDIFYYHQLDALDAICASSPREWSWFEPCPAAIIGFVPHGNVMNMAQPLGLYFSLFRHVHGSGAKITYPGGGKAWTAKHTDTEQLTMARFEIFASLQPREKVHQQKFNVGHHAQPTTWAHKWAKMVAYFGLVGLGPGEEGAASGDLVKLGAWWEHYADRYEEMAAKNGLAKMSIQRKDIDFVGFVIELLDFDIDFDLTKARELGFEEEMLPEVAYFNAWDRMIAANILPVKN